MTVPLLRFLSDARNEENKHRQWGSFEPGKGERRYDSGLRKGHEMCLVPWRLFLQPCKGCCRRDASKIPEQFPDSSVTLYYGYSGKKIPYW